MENKLWTGNKTAEIVQISLIAAITCLVTMTIRVPTLIGYTHLGDSMVFLSAILLGKKNGTIGAALGMFLADMLGAYFIWAPFTLVIKGGMAYIAATIAYRKDFNGLDTRNNILAFLCAGTWMVLAYYIANAVITRFIYVKTASINESLIIALGEVPGNIIEVLVGIILAVPLIKGIRKYFYKK
ncbi:putative membrane protein [Clostridium tetanomorphum]|uniref:ECF transporter S component n=1 Tax=Clostridium tetanomorphum TaxID=1553 RepID=A0A923J191_CLOTT|nr:ECF transporter S component [Clostridium tetanomorphum]KAJ50565.1 membrane spanning protein [Clostridium tetanomorphum DSM 665]MBC2399026.1 ECF transporter S component [Clostridium tetanomorphum]MBP1862639.1 putative membrane protein [Clostridium tetanomorphum]NRS85520.1 putative membrane protein [Clostridium tetanomorphum]NRZ98634.1 putative membrane protein [Clostridium tetanomorphum]